MKISSLEGNSAYHEFSHLCVVTLDGKEVDGFVYADDEDGKVTYFDENGELATTRGIVTITFPEEKAAVFEDAHQDFLAVAEEEKSDKKAGK